MNIFTSEGDQRFSTLISDNATMICMPKQGFAIAMYSERRADSDYHRYAIIDCEDGESYLHGISSLDVALFALNDYAREATADLAQAIAEIKTRT